MRELNVRPELNPNLFIQPRVKIYNAPLFNDGDNGGSDPITKLAIRIADAEADGSRVLQVLGEPITSKWPHVPFWDLPTWSERLAYLGGKRTEVVVLDVLLLVETTEM